MDLSAAMQLEGVELVSWDLDGTLYSARALKRAWLRHHLPRMPLLGVQNLLASRRFHREVERQRGHGNVDSEALSPHLPAARAEAELLPRLLARIGPRRDALELLQRLREHVPLHVVVSDFAPEAKLEALGLTSAFAATYAGEVLGHWKPSAALLSHVARAHGVAPQALLHIGDRDDTDGEAARRAGARFWKMPPG